ncbi:MAG: hypothetical protein WCD86_21010 [Ktedonobacteraceae bacterium]
MDRKEDRDMLRRVGFAEAEVMRLSKLRREYTEKEKVQATAHRRRLEFARWLVTTGKITDQLAS